MKPKTRQLVGVFIFILLIIAWAPWLTEDYACGKVTEHLGGADSEFKYLNEMMTVAEVPKTYTRVPFAILVYFPSEAMYMVTFYGSIM